MNEPAKLDAAVERISVAEFEARAASGMFDEDVRVELLRGRPIGMVAKSANHRCVEAALLVRWYAACPPGHVLAPEVSLRLGEDTLVEPDIVIYPEDPGLAGLNGETVELVVEIADASLAFDSGRKAELYAGLGVRELWVVDAETLAVTVLRDPAPEGFRASETLAAEQIVTPLVAPLDFALAFGQLRRD